MWSGITFLFYSASVKEAGCGSIWVWMLFYKKGKDQPEPKKNQEFTRRILKISPVNMP